MKKLAIILFMIFSNVTVFSVDESSTFFLIRGPIPHNGIEYLGVNTIASYYGKYSYGNDQVTIYFTTKDVFFSDDWSILECSIEGVFQLDTESERQVAAYTDKKGWTAFFSFEPDSDYLCDFIRIYRNRQNYFLNIAREDTGFSFPAFLEFK